MICGTCSISHNGTCVCVVGDLKKLAWVHRIGSVIEAEVLNRLITPNYANTLLYDSCGLFSAGAEIKNRKPNY